MQVIENDFLKATIKAKGAELSGLQHKQTGIEYIWQADPAFWGKHSPVLFPVVGTLKNNGFLFEGKEYPLGRHGFARDMDFSVAEIARDSVTFRLEASEATLAIFPFPFRFDITYLLKAATLTVIYEVINTGGRELFFSVGGHPAFRVPLEAGLVYEDYYLEFDEEEDAGRWPISPEGLIEKAPLPFFNRSGRIPLTKSLFYQDALVFKYLRSSSVSLRSGKGGAGITVDVGEFPYLGIWAAKNADFVCIEPWCGIADSVEADRQIIRKEGINRLVPGNTFNRAWSVHCF
jgi:galactose mutarotase-like enzyme